MLMSHQELPVYRSQPQHRLLPVRTIGDIIGGVEQSSFQQTGLPDQIRVKRFLENAIDIPQGNFLKQIHHRYPLKQRNLAGIRHARKSPQGLELVDMGF